MRRLLGDARERGASAVEFAIVLPLLAIILLGMVDFGLALNSQAIVNNAARDGARAGSFAPAATTTYKGSTMSVAKATALASSSALLGTAPTVTVTCYTSGTTTAVDCGSAAAGDTIEVKLSYAYTWLTPSLPGLGGLTALSGFSQMRIETT